MATPFRAVISAIPAPGHDSRHRAGPKGRKLRWTTTPIEVVVDESPKYEAKPMVISFADWAELQTDRQIRAIPAGGGDPEVPNLKAALLEAEAKIAKLERQLATAAEEWDSERRSATQEIEKLADGYRKLEAEAANLRTRLAEARRPKALGGKE